MDGVVNLHHWGGGYFLDWRGSLGDYFYGAFELGLIVFIGRDFSRSLSVLAEITVELGLDDFLLETMQAQACRVKFYIQTYGKSDIGTKIGSRRTIGFLFCTINYCY